MRDGSLSERQVPLVEVLDRVIDKGAVVNADALIGLADVDLIRVALRLVIAPADKVAGTAPGAASSAVPIIEAPPADDRQHDEPAASGAGPRPLPAVAARSSAPAEPADHHGLDRGLAQLVLTVVELLRELMDRQAVRRAMRGNLSDGQAERLGVALMELDERMDELVAAFGLDRRDLNLDLGPLGDLL